MKYQRKIVHSRNLKKLVIITGQQRSGKSTLTNIISSLKGPINIQIEFFLDSLFSLKRLNYISVSALHEILHLYLNNLIIDLNYGRNLNLRKNEESSIWNTENPKYFLKRIEKKFSPEEIKKSLAINNEIFMVCHNFIEFLEIFPINKYELKVINIQSHPVDQIYSMYNAKTNFKFNKLSREIIYTYKKNKYCLSVGLEDRFQSLNLMQKILLIKNNQDIKEVKNLNQSNNYKCLNLNYEELIVNPNTVVRSVCSFTGKKQTKYTNEVIKINNRKKKFLDINNRKKRLEFINSKLREKRFKNILENMIVKFEKANA